VTHPAISYGPGPARARPGPRVAVPSAGVRGWVRGAPASPADVADSALRNEEFVW